MTSFTAGNPVAATAAIIHSTRRILGWKLLIAAAAVVLLTGCESAPPYVYHYIPGRTAALSPDGTAVVPPRAPAAVRAAVAAGNEIAGSAYVYGGGHGGGSGGFDCSGATSYVLRAAGRLHDSMPSEGFRHYGESGPGRWISVYARDGHVFLVVAGLRFDTGWTGDENSGPRWTQRSRPTDGCVIRHPPGL